MIVRPDPSIADPARPTATFSVARRELLGPDTLLGQAELARILCRSAERRIAILALTPGRLRRVDGWLTGDALVTHGVAPDAATPTVGALCARHHASALLRSIIESLVGPVPGGPATSPIPIPALAELAAGRPPSGADWLLVLSATPVGAPAERWCLAGTGDGLAGASLADPTTTATLDPIEAPSAWSHVGRLLGEPGRHATSAERSESGESRP